MIPAGTSWLAACRPVIRIQTQITQAVFTKIDAYSGTDALFNLAPPVALRPEGHWRLSIRDDPQALPRSRCLSVTNIGQQIRPATGIVDVEKQYGAQAATVVSIC